jgi:acyl-CoA synthetase (AMP-forming)/AMP-acid ligase II
MTDTTAAPPPADFNLAAYLLAANAKRADKVAYADDRSELTYAELSQRVRSFSKVLRTSGVRREERVLLLAHDTVEWPVAFLGCIYAGVVPVAVNTLLTADDYAYMLGHSHARAAIVSAEVAEREADRASCAILDVVLRHGSPSVRPDDVLAALGGASGLRVTAALQQRLAQGPLDPEDGTVGDPLTPDRDAAGQ